jgi:hypothetical protein
MADEMIPIVMFLMMGLVFVVFLYLKFRAKAEAQQTIRLALGIDEQDAMGPLMGTAAFPTLIGVAHLIMWRYGARQQ